MPTVHNLVAVNQFVSAESRNKVVLKENLDVHVCISINSYMYT